MHVSYEANLIDNSKKVNRVNESSDENISSIKSWLPSSLAVDSVHTISCNDTGNLFTLNKFNNALKYKIYNQTHTKSDGQKNNLMSKENIVIDIEKTIQNFHKSVK
jgi:hypothetical protein